MFVNVGDNFIAKGAAICCKAEDICSRQHSQLFDLQKH